MKLVSIGAKVYGSVWQKRDSGRDNENSNSHLFVSEKYSKVSRANSICSIQEVDNKGDNEADNDDFDMGAVEQGFVVVEPKSREIIIGVTSSATVVGPLMESNEAEESNAIGLDYVEAFDGDNAV